MKVRIEIPFHSYNKCDCNKADIYETYGCSSPFCEFANNPTNSTFADIRLRTDGPAYKVLIHHFNRTPETIGLKLGQPAF